MIIDILIGVLVIAFGAHATWYRYQQELEKDKKGGRNSP